EAMPSSPASEEGKKLRARLVFVDDLQLAALDRRLQLCDGLPPLRHCLTKLLGTCEQHPDRRARGKRETRRRAIGDLEDLLIRIDLAAAKTPDDFKEKNVIAVALGRVVDRQVQRFVLTDDVLRHKLSNERQMSREPG